MDFNYIYAQPHVRYVRGPCASMRNVCTPRVQWSLCACAVMSKIAKLWLLWSFPEPTPEPTIVRVGSGVVNESKTERLEKLQKSRAMYFTPVLSSHIKTFRRISIAMLTRKKSVVSFQRSIRSQVNNIWSTAKFDSSSFIVWYCTEFYWERGFCRVFIKANLKCIKMAFFFSRLLIRRL